MINRANSISLSALQEIIQNQLYNIDSYWIVAEINELKVNTNGHCYLNLVEKDEKTQYIKAGISATIWASVFRMINPYFESVTGQSLKSGIKILVKIHVQYHELYGLSLNITDIEPSYTVGEIELAKQKIIKQLKEDGVFEINKELPFPVLPQRIAVISSSKAAGYRDFIQQLSGNKYGYVFKTTLFEAVMQGVNAEASIIAAIEEIYKNYQLFDIVVIIRGGGSQTDLSCFDLYDLVYHATQLPLPYLTGIGHDKDVSILDLTAYKMLKTPTATADFIINHYLALEQEIDYCKQKLINVANNKILEETGFITELGVKIKNLLNNVFYKEKMLLNSILPDKMKIMSKQLIEKQQFKIDSLKLQVSSLNPFNILNKGYSITLHNGKKITPDAKISEGDEIITILYNTKISSTVKKTENYDGNDL
ncbi:MAG: exodeoxyribonuclease VII large subunit [Prevotellaceae bacterium]|jgi:exodeoxyribonuclease VII large subunit|nr:exodeoxyribonuclease VII large subunit [Prevotellaceae bacterium]